MPVTAKLSRKFYERLGDDIADELVDWFNAVDATYKADLKATNELNWERFKATLHEEISSLRVELLGRISSLDGSLRGEMSSLRVELLGQISSLDGSLREEMSSLRAELFGRISSLDGSLHGEMSSLRGELSGEMSSLRGELRGEISSLRGDLRSEMKAMQANLMKWMFIYWSGTVAAIIGMNYFGPK